MAACPPAPASPAGPGPGWPEWSQERSAALRAARHDADTTACSPVGQLRAMAWLMGITRPALAASTCSRLASGAAACRSRYDATQWLDRAGLGPAAAAHVAGLVWPEVSGGGGVGEDAASARVGPRRRPEDVGSGAAGSSPA